MTQKGFAKSIFGIVFIFCLLPVLAMVYSSLSGEYNYRTIFETEEVFQSFVNSTFLSLSVATLTTFIGTFIGILISKTDFYFSKFILLFLLIPMFLPPYILALGWIDVVGVTGRMSTFLFGFLGTVLVLFSVYLPISILLTLFFLKQIDPQLERSALLFCDEKKVLQKITLPLISPAVILGFLLVFVLTFGEYSVANVLRFSVFPLESFIQFSAFYDFDAAVAMAMPMLMVAIAVIFIEQLYLSKRVFKYKTYRDMIIFTLKKKEKIFLLFFTCVFVFVIVVLPLSGLFFTVGTVDNLFIAFEKALDPLLRSLIFAIFGATLLMIFGFLTGYVLFLKIPKLSRILDAAILFLFVLPATILGIALILFWNRPFIDFIYTSPLIIIFGYFSKYLALSVKISQTKLLSIPNSMIEAAQISGANWFEILRFILLPASKKILISIFIVGFVFSLRENTITMLVYPPGYETLPIYIVTQMANGKEEIVAALSVVMILVSLLPFLLFSFWQFIGEKNV